MVARERGRPTDYNEEVVNRIFAQMAKGRTLLDICENDEGMPAYRTVYDWTKRHPEFSAELDNARAIAAEAILDQAHDISRSREKGVIKVTREVLNRDGEIVTLTEYREYDAVDSKKLKVDTSVRIAAFWNKTKYGAKTSVTAESDKDTGSLNITITGGLPTD